MSQAPKAGRFEDADIDTVADLITSMSRTLHALSEHEALKGDDIGVAEWAMLRSISQHSGMRAGQLARRLGISPQRANQVINALRSADYIDVQRSNEDTRARDIAITPLGQAKLAAADREIFALFSDAFGGRTHVISTLRAPVSRLANSLSRRKAVRADKAGLDTAFDDLDED